MRVFIKGVDDTKIFVTIEPTNTVDFLKEKVAAKFEIDKAGVKLLFGGKWLVDEKTLADYNVQEGSSLHLVVNVGTQISNQMQIFVENFDGKKVSFRVERQNTVNSLKVTVAATFGLNNDSFSLLFEGKCLKNKNTLANHSIQEGAALVAKKKIYVKNIDDVRKTLFMVPQDTISSLKEIVATAFNATKSDVKLLFGGKWLADEKTLASYDVQEGSVVHFVLRVHGGCA